ncbi:MAG TPA: peptidase M48 Ste24p [Pseudomonas xinjiangensis]|uniref:Peptidase M48 Ste24p n=2 Tax=root TaxID=1 RepID=A0A7V1BP27_9GAMM|nr:peptidase M48 Ste24p [Halopseudomonas xinjiangensis]HEC48331.1 peptidase M48 Ste24p [Halopseudomonas xinjiangensis]
MISILRIAPLVLLLLLTGCAVNPVTGKKDFVMMSEAQELALGRQASAQIEQQMPLVEDAALQAYVQNVGEKLAQKSHRNQLNYEFAVVDSPDINAFALPGGYLYIHRGLLAYLNSEAELAAVLGHEIGHVTARHGVRQQSMSMGTGLLGALVAAGTGVRAAGDLSNMLGTALVRGYGRDMELEADGLGAEYLARAGYRPDAVLDVIGVLKNQDSFARERAAAQGRQVAGYHGLFATHPTHDQRLQEVVAQAQNLTVDATQRTGRDEYLKAIEGMVYGDSPEQGIVRGRNFYHTQLNLALEYPPSWVVVNQPDVLLAHTPDQSAFIALTMQAVPDGSGAEDVLAQRVGNQRLVAAENFSGKGFTGTTAVIPGDQARRVAAIVRGGQAFLFVGAFKGRGPLENYDDAFLSVIRSFRPLSAADRKRAQPLHVRLYRVRRGDSYEQLAEESPLGEQAEAQLRLLNGDWPDGQLKAGQWLKVIR